MKIQTLILTGFLFISSAYGQLQLPEDSFNLRHWRLDPKEKLNGHIKKITWYDIWIKDASVQSKKDRKPFRRLPHSISFHENGKIKEEAYSQPSFSFHNYFKYDSLWRLVSITDRSGGKNLPVESIIYNDKGRQITKIKYDEGTLLTTIIYSFDDQNWLIRREEYNENKVLAMVTRYIYTKDGRLQFRISKNHKEAELPVDTRETKFGSSGLLWKEDTLRYEYKFEDGKEVTQAFRKTDADKEYLYLRRESKDSSYQSIVLYADKPAGKKHLEHILIDSSGKQTLYQNSSLTSNDITRYDHQNNPLALKLNGADFLTAEYKKDSRGNWIEKKEFRAEGKDAVNMEEREIEYYDRKAF